MAQEINKGLFITFEGPEGSGKSTHSKRLYDDLVSDGYIVRHTMEPGGTPLGSKIREILLQKDDIRLDAVAELFLFEADRAQHITEYIKPYIDEENIVICDRFNTATFAYQGFGLGMDMEMIRNLDTVATGGICPDLTILMDLDIETGLERAGGASSADRMEKRGTTFHEKVREGYLTLAKEAPDRIKVVKVQESIDKTYGIIKEMVYGFVEQHKRTG